VDALINKLDKQPEISQILTSGVSSAEKMLQVQKLLGLPIDNTLKEAAKSVSQVSKWERLAAVDTAAGGTDGSLGNLFMALTGGALGGPLGYVGGQMASKAISVAGKPNRALALLSGLERANVFVEKAVTKASEAMYRGIITGVSGQGGKILAGKTDSGSKMKFKSFGPVYQSYQKLTDPTTRQGIIAQATESLSEAPQIQAAVAKRMDQAAQLLVESLPVRVQVASLTPNAVPAQAFTAAEKGRFIRMTQVIDSPLEWMENVSRGVMPSPLEVKAFSTLYPGVYQQIKEKIEDSLLETKIPLSPQQAAYLKVFLGAGQNPQDIQDTQGKLYSPANKPKPSSGSPATPNGKVLEMLMTSSERAQYR
jgi:hypothetical protein